VGTAYAEEVEHGGLGFEDGSAANGADFDRGHGDGDLEVTVDAVAVSLILIVIGFNLLVHDGDAVGTLNNLRGILPSSQEHGGDNIRRVRVETTHSTRHG
jgi:hypothetical protein